MVPLHRLALPALAILALLGSCDRVSTPQESELPSQLDLRFGIWSDSAEAARDSLRQDRPFPGAITVGDTLWVRVRTEGDSVRIRSVDAFFDGSWKSVPLPVFFPVSWTDSGLQKVKVGLFTDEDQFFDSLLVRVTDETPVVRLPAPPGNGSLVVRPGETNALFARATDDGRVDSLRWDLDGDGTPDTATLSTDTLRVSWSLDLILAARRNPFLRVVARDEDGNEARDSLALVLEVPPPSLTLDGPDTVSIGDTVRLSAVATGIAGLFPTRWQDNATGASFTVVAPLAETTLTVRASVRDSMGGSDSAAHTVVVVRDAPLADAGPDLAVHAGRAVRLSGAATQRFGNIASWGWDLDNDGVFTTSTASAGIDTAWQTVGIRTVVLRVQDDDGNVDLDTLLVAVTDSAPSVTFASPPALARRDSFTLAATATDPEGDSLVVLWVVDGDTSLGATRRVAFDSVGIHVVEAIARSFTPAGISLATATLTDTILVVADPPRLDLGPDSTVAWGGTWRALRAIASDSTGSIASTEWDWNGDGSWDTTTTGWSAPLHRFAGDTGRVVVRARVTDDDGNRVVDSLVLRVDPAPWNVVVAAPSTAARLTDLVVKLSWTDSAKAPSRVRWTSNEGLDVVRDPLADVDSIVLQGRLVDTLRLTLTLTTPMGSPVVRSVAIALDALGEGPQVFVYGPDSVSWGDTIALSAETVGQIEGSEVVWWNQRTGRTNTIFAPFRDSLLVLKVRVTDNLGRVDSATRTVRVVRDAPVADAGPDIAVHAGATVRLSGAATQRFGNIVSWGWDLDNDGVFTTSTASAGIDTAWQTVGIRTVVLRVQDDDGNIDLDTLEVTVSDKPPALSFTVPSTALIGDSIRLSVSGSDPDGDLLEFAWVVDGDTLPGPTVAFVAPRRGSLSVVNLARSYSRPGAKLRDSTTNFTIALSSEIMVSLLAPESTWIDTAAAGIRLRAVVQERTPVTSIQWTTDSGATWTEGSPSGEFSWIPTTVGDHRLVVRVRDSAGAVASDTKVVRVRNDLPVVDLPDSLRIMLGGRTASIPLQASTRFGGIASVRWSWTDLDGAHVLDTTFPNPTRLTTSLAGPFAPGRYLVRVRVVDERGEATTDSTVLSAVGLRARLSVAPDSVATLSNLHAEGAWDVWPVDTAVETGFTFDGQEYAGRSVLDVAPSETGIYRLVFWARFAGSQTRFTAWKSVQSVYDPPVIQTFPDDTIAEGTRPDLSFTASRRLGGIAAWVWDLSGATGNGTTLRGFATHANSLQGRLDTVSLLPGSRPVGYGVVGDGGDTTWVTRNFLVVGAPHAVDDVLGLSTRDGLDVTCEAGLDCDIQDNFLVGNDAIGAGLEGTPKLVAALDGAVLDSNTDGRLVRLLAPAKAGVQTFRYVISNGLLKDTGTVNITIYERTDPASLDLKTYPLQKAYVQTEGDREWLPPPSGTWTPIFPRTATSDFASVVVEYPKITGSRMATGNVPQPGYDTLAVQGADLYAIDPGLAFRLLYGESDWMKAEEETLEFRFRVGTRRNDGLGVPGRVVQRDFVVPLTFQRQVMTSVVPDPKMSDLRPTYNCDGSTSFDYLFNVAAVKNPHEGDFIKFAIEDLPQANNGKGYQDGDITATFTDVSGKPTPIVFKRDAFNWIVGNLPVVGGTLKVTYTINGLLNGQGLPPGTLSMSWAPSGGNAKATHLQQSKGGSFTLASSCKAQ